ncbi:hypothetical protein [Bradyrhizobium sp. DASA03007]|uniref:hypothetical protein n=1 Tax=unclassified Bradyrhizobium TaxID=2631580 RepID=UPI003F6F0A5B
MLIVSTGLNNQSDNQRSAPAPFFKGALNDYYYLLDNTAIPLHALNRTSLNQLPERIIIELHQRLWPPRLENERQRGASENRPRCINIEPALSNWSASPFARGSC